MHNPISNTWPDTFGNAFRFDCLNMAIRSFNTGWLRQ